MNLFSLACFAIVLNAEPAGRIVSMQVTPPEVGKSDRVAYSITFATRGEASPADEVQMKRLIESMRERGGKHTPAGHYVLAGGIVTRREKDGETVVFDQLTGPVVEGKDGEFIRVGTATQDLRAVNIDRQDNTCSIKMSFAGQPDMRYIAHVSEVLTSYVEEKLFEGKAAKFVPNISVEAGQYVVTLTHTASK